VDESSGQRVFETYEMKDGTSDASPGIVHQLEDALKSSFDLLIVCDYGHGLIEGEVLTRLGGVTPPMALNVQANAGNRGFNTFGKYLHADFLCMNGGELALEARRKHVRAEELMPEIQRALAATSVIVTEGDKGMLVSDSAGVTRVPAFAPFVRDRVGAGDALFSITSLGQALDLPKEIIGFLGNLAGAASVSQLGNSQSLKAVDIARHAQSLMK
jgi:bifunctional ADP-heptose synthase (sugar kinase/adenylyltransferase)